MIRIPDSSEFLRVAEQEARAHELTLYSKRRVPPEEAAILEDLGIHLIVPMNSPEQHLVGLLLLGEKKSDEPYTAADRKLLDALGSQIALLCENLLLKEKVDQEVKVREEVLVHLTAQNKNVMKECPVCGRCYDQSATNCSVDFSELILSLPVERLIDGKYRLDRKVGRGGMGAVYRATDTKLGREVAVKILIGSMFGDRAALRRFEREARTSAALKHPNIVTVYDFGQLEGQGAFLVMEFIEGQTLRSLFQTQARLSRSVVRILFEQILDGVQAAHEQNVVHRDLKPENILITNNVEGKTVVKILDFGLAKIQHPEGQSSTNSLTGPGSVLGTISYMSPEQITGADVDVRSDIFSVGILIAEALTGETPFQGETSSDIALSILQKPFHLYEDPPVDRVLQKCLAKKPNNRYKSIAELQQDLLPLLASASV
jgi:eukaryotic-like serine/threonine-protein kinase